MDNIKIGNGIYFNPKLEKLKSLCNKCTLDKDNHCVRKPEMLILCMIDAMEYRLRTGHYNTGNSRATIKINKDINGVVLDNKVVTIEDIKRLFINRTDCYSLQDNNSPEKFPDIKEELTDEIILRSLLGEITIGIRPVNPETKKIKWICWDIDSEENDNPKEVVKVILSCLKKRGLNGYVEMSGSKDSYHVWIFIEPIDNDLAFEFDENFKAEVEKLLADKGNVYIDRGVHKGEQLGSGMIKLPFNVQRKNNVRSKFANGINLSKIQPQKLIVKGT